MYAVPGTARNSTPASCATKASFCECPTEYGGTEGTAGFSPLVWQHELFAPIAGEPQVCAMARQQSGWLACRVPSKQADTGIVAQKATTASISNAPFLPQFMVYRSRVLTVSIRHRASRSDDSDHITDSRRTQLLKLNLSDSLEFCRARLQWPPTCEKRASPAPEGPRL